MALTVQDEVILARIKSMVTATLIERAAAQPDPPYPPDVVEVMDFVRRNPDPEKPRYLIVTTEDGFAIGVRSRERGGVPELLGEVPHRTRDEAEHAVFLRRLRDYGVTW
ncbi:hypothetical protein [Streptomyces shenzhenensis]|uniref:N,N-dimethylformamidase alpha subunit domain-containing protein n=1 Tax=Streptomyces shenzhenensis TaxID=943815 RepID=A0A3M0I2F6_9ACTN|nr:hypothetical protein [Streptomyces shenzhenensis]RMB82628.1 hypothetical protein CTZ28_28150 [Streptomyces shenzhenensis]